MLEDHDLAKIVRRQLRALKAILLLKVGLTGKARDLMFCQRGVTAVPYSRGPQKDPTMSAFSRLTSAGVWGQREEWEVGVPAHSLHPTPRTATAFHLGWAALVIQIVVALVRALPVDRPRKTQPHTWLAKTACPHIPIYHPTLHLKCFSSAVGSSFLPYSWCC